MEALRIAGRTTEPGKTPILIAGPCVLENLDDAERVAKECAEAAAREGFFYIFKSSYLKDNRSSLGSYVGPGLEKGLDMLSVIGAKAKVPLLTDVHCREEIPKVAGVVDVIQIPAFLVRQTRLVVAASKTGKVVNLKKSQMLSPEEMANAVEKARASGAGGIMVTERGTFFGYNNLVVDFTAFPRMRPFGVPLIFDATHSLQLPGGLGKRSGGRPEYAATLARAAVASGCDGLFIETHFAPLDCKCDAEAMLPLRELKKLLSETKRLFELVRGFGA
ncbi:MAG: 3-deoxy-8-phosphooctulonate synthase [Candidatus Krumholzibacteria bacterium]|nr:3-deoxy-8-phosphooctulonate synthase [Candidatus Krumholzibacteria bacterium]